MSQPVIGEKQLSKFKQRITGGTKAYISPEGCMTNVFALRMFIADIRLQDYISSPLQKNISYISVSLEVNKELGVVANRLGW